MDNDEVETTLQSAVFGDREAIQQIARRLKSPPPSEVLRTVDERLAFRSAVDWFKSEYRDVADDPMLYQLVTAEDTRLARESPQLSYLERLRAAGETVRTWRGKVAGPSVARPPAAGARQAGRPRDDYEEGEEDPAAVIDRMAEARHQKGAIRKQLG